MVNFSIDGDIAVIELDDGKANVFSEATSLAVLDCLKQAEANAKATIIRAIGDKFSAGFDLGAMGGSAQAKEDMITAGLSILYRIYAHPQPVVAACNGHALGLGAFVLLVADTRLGAEGDFKIGLPETAGNMPFNLYLVAILSAELSRPAMKTAALQSIICSPDTAVDAGFLDKVVPAEALQASARHATEQLMQLPVGQYGDNKQIIRHRTLQLMRDSMDTIL